MDAPAREVVRHPAGTSSKRSANPGNLPASRTKQSGKLAVNQCARQHGAYAYGRRRQETVLDKGRKLVRRGIVRRDPQDWMVLLRDHHDGYITWDQFERNQELLAENMTKVRGAVRVDAAVGVAVMDALQPVGIEAALVALKEREHDDGAALRLARSALAEARYQAERAEAQFNAVEPANQNVFHNLARKWEECLSRVRDCEARIQALEASTERQQALTPEEHHAYLALGEDLPRVWNHEKTSPQLRKRLLRAVLVEIIATIKGREIHLLLHWKGGDHTHLVVPRNRIGEHRWTTDAETGELIRDLARMLPDELIAGLLNRLGKKTGKGNSWTKSRVCSFRSTRGIAVYRDGERQERGELILSEAAERLDVDPVVIRRLIRSGILAARQACKGAPWIIREEALACTEVLNALSQRRPLTPDPNQTSFDFQ